MDVELWKKNIVMAVSDIADKSFQEKVWLHETSIVSSPVEVYCTLFDDFLFHDFLESEKVGLTETQKEAGRKLIAALDLYSPSGSDLPSPGQMMSDPKWDQVRLVAKQFLESLR